DTVQHHEQATVHQIALDLDDLRDSGEGIKRQENRQGSRYPKSARLFRESDRTGPLPPQQPQPREQDDRTMRALLGTPALLRHEPHRRDGKSEYACDEKRQQQQLRQAPVAENRSSTAPFR